MAADSPTSCDVLCTGLIVADHVAAPVPALPASGALVSTPKTELTIGGCAANVAVDLVKLDVPANLVGRVGNDVLGQFVIDRLQAAGVGCHGLVASDVSQTATTLVVNVEGEDRRFIHAPGANVELTGHEVTAQMLSECRIVYVGGFGMNPALSGTNVAEMFATARRLGVLTVLDVVVGDPQTIAELMTPVLPFTDLFLPNTDEARLMTGIESPVRQAEHFRSLGASAVAVTCGGDGAVLVSQPGGARRIKAHSVDQVDGTGGGDAFAAGMMLGLLNDADLEECLLYGAAMGASCVQTTGATTGTFNRAELREFVEQHPLAVEAI
jgi:sugar/nucleoside kinase (ribokinase family)